MCNHTHQKGVLGASCLVDSWWQTLVWFCRMSEMVSSCEQHVHLHIICAVTHGGLLQSRPAMGEFPTSV